MYLAIVLAVTLLLLGGCGGSESPESDADQIRAVFERYQSAVAAGDGETICGDLIAVSEVRRSRKRCERVFSERRLASSPLRRASEAELGAVEVEGNNAQADELTFGGYFSFVRERNRWYLQVVR